MSGQFVLFHIKSVSQYNQLRNEFHPNNNHLTILFTRTGVIQCLGSFRDLPSAKPGFNLARVTGWICQKGVYDATRAAAT